MNKAVFLDRDGTINVEKQYLYKIEDFSFMPDSIEGLRLLQDAGFLLVVITNQSGIARGYYTQEDFDNLNKWMLKTLKSQGVDIAKVYYCPHLPNAPVNKYDKVCDCRKPNIGLFLRAIEELGIDIDKSYAIGDKIRDCSICETTGCQGYLISNNERPEVINKVKNGLFPNIHYSMSLLDCCKEIVQHVVL